MRQKKAKPIFYSLVDEGYYPIGTKDNKYCKALMREVKPEFFKVGPGKGDFYGAYWWHSKHDKYDTDKCREIFGDLEITINCYDALEKDSLGFKSFNMGEAWYSKEWIYFKSPVNYINPYFFLYLCTELKEEKEKIYIKDIRPVVKQVLKMSESMIKSYKVLLKLSTF